MQVHIVREKVTWPGARIRKQDEGMPNYENNHKKGSLFITFDVDFPRNGFTEEQKQRKFTVSLLFIKIRLIYQIGISLLFNFLARF